MINLIILTVTAILAETIFYPFPFTLLIVITIILGMGYESLIWVFLSGIFLDIFALRTIGLSSIFFLILAALILRYNRRFQLANIIYILFFILIAVTLDLLIFYSKFLTFNYFIISVSVGLLLLYFLPVIFRYRGGRKKIEV